MPIFDWYLIATPLFAVLSILSLVVLKLSLKAEPNINQSIMRKLKTQQTQRTQDQETSMTQKYASLKVFKYLATNHSFLQFCLTKKSKNKVPMILAITVISALCLVNRDMVINSLAGIPIVLVFVAAQTLFQQDDANSPIMDQQAEDFSYIRQQAKQQDKVAQKNKILYIVCNCFAIGISLIICSLTFKNYSNSFLSLFVRNLLVSSSIDMFALRFVGFAIFSFPLSFSKRFIAFIQTEQLKQLYGQFAMNQLKNVKNCATNLSPRKQSNSPTKVPKALVKLNRQNSQTEALASVMQLARKIKKQKIGQSQLMRPLSRANQIQNARSILQQNSLNNLFQQFQSNPKQNNQRATPIKMFREQQENQGEKTKRKQSDLIIVEFKKNQQNKQQQNFDQDAVRRRPGSFIHSNLNFQDQQNNRQDTNKKDHNLLKCTNEQIENEQQYQNQNDEQRNRAQNYAAFSHQRNDPLRICHHQDEQQQIEELDTNSPNRRRGRGMSQLQESEYKLKKKAKHFNGNAKRRVIKFSSGQPYLEYLPNMLSKDNSFRHKKSQPITMKPDLQPFDDRKKIPKKNKAKKQHKIVYGGDQNQFPGTLQVQDL